MDVLSCADVVDTSVILPAGVGDPLPATSAGDLRPAAGVGDLRSTLAAGAFSNVAGVSLLSPATDTEASTSARCWTSGGLPAVTTS